MEKNKKNLKEALKFSISLAEEVGHLLIKFQKKLDKLSVTSKDAQGMVSTADYKAEELILKRIKSIYSDHEILAEESAYKKFKGKILPKKYYGSKKWTWIIDPLDGTHNYLNAFDYYSVSISLAYFGVPVLGVIYRPETGECFYATENEGAYLDRPEYKRKRKLFSSRNSKSLLNSCLITGFSAEKGIVFDKEFEQFKNLMLKSRSVRRIGSAALDMCYVASGVWDGFWERDLSPWDVAAAFVICNEAGVEVTDYGGQKFNVFNKTILAARSPLNKKIILEL